MADGSRLTLAKQAEHAARAERLAKALRRNLRRRKEQERAQDEPAEAETGTAGSCDKPASPDSAA